MRGELGFDILCGRSPGSGRASIFERRKLEIQENCNVYILRSRKAKEDIEIERGRSILQSVYGRTTDALASGGDEGRGRLR